MGYSEHDAPYGIYRPPKEIWVKEGNGTDLLQVWNSYMSERTLRIPRGNYVLPSPLYIPDGSNAEISVVGQSREGVIITDSTGCNALDLITSQEANWTSTSRVTLRNITFTGNNNIYKAVNLPFCHVDIQNVTINGNFKAAGAGARKCLYVGGSAATATPSIIDNVSIQPSNTVNILAELWLEGLGGGTIALNDSDADATTALSLHGTHAHFNKLLGFIGNGKSLTDFIVTDTLDVDIGSIFYNKTGVPTLLPNIFAVDAGSVVSVHGVNDGAGCVLFKDATSQAQTRITGSYNAKGAWNSDVATGTGAQQTIAHGLSRTPARVLLSEATTGGALAYQSAATDATNIYVLATLNKTFNWRAEI